MAKVMGRLPGNSAEAKVVLALKEQLPADWLVIPSVRWAKRFARGVRDGEADVVVLAPGLGLLVVEVKGSAKIRVSDAVWERFDPKASRWINVVPSPVAQATQNSYDVVQILGERLQLGSTFPGRFGWLVVYPNGIANQVPAMFDHSTLATRAHMDKLHASVRDALLARDSSSSGNEFTMARAEDVVKVLTSAEFRVLSADGEDEVASDKEVIELLTRQQFAALRGVFEFPSVAVAGPAGSGKTVLALWRLQAVVSAGQRAIYVCYNNRLAEALRLREPSLAGHIHSASQLFGKTCPGSRPVGNLDSFHRKELPNYVFDEVSGWNDERKFDAVIVDEAQDLSEAQLIALSAFAKPGGSWSVFLDQRQNIYGSGLDGGLVTDVLFRLSHNCRNTVSINSRTNEFVASTIDSMPGMPRGVPVTVEKVKRPQMANRAFQLASEWGARSSNSVAILSPYVLEKSAFVGSEKGHGVTLSMDLADLQVEGKAYFSTIKSFKGIEADCVIVIDADDPNRGNPAFTLEDLYVACTRAKARLAILVHDEATAGFYRGK